MVSVDVKQRGSEREIVTERGDLVVRAALCVVKMGENVGVCVDCVAITFNNQRIKVFIFVEFE